MGESCELCNGLRGHHRLRDAIRKPFQLELDAARKEYARLSCLLEDLVWYNFEVNCKDWGPPWYSSVLDTNVVLYAHQY